MGCPGLLAAHWEDPALLSWAVADAALEPLLPGGLAIDRWEGSAYISLVGLVFDRVRVLGLPFPPRRYGEVNLRFYVRRADAGGDPAPGVVFIRQIVPHRVTAWAARRLYGEPFAVGPVRCGAAATGYKAGGSGRRVEYSWRRGGRWHTFRVETDAAPARAGAGTLEEFLTARYWGYNGKPGGGARGYRLTRPEWTLQRATAWGPDGDLAAEYGPRLGDAMSGAPASALLASGGPARVHWPAPVRFG